MEHQFSVSRLVLGSPARESGKGCHQISHLAAFQHFSRISLIKAVNTPAGQHKTHSQEDGCVAPEAWLGAHLPLSTGRRRSSHPLLRSRGSTCCVFGFRDVLPKQAATPTATYALVYWNVRLQAAVSVRCYSQGRADQGVCLLACCSKPMASGNLGPWFLYCHGSANQHQNAFFC